jgi:hypothetical protein
MDGNRRTIMHKSVEDVHARIQSARRNFATSLVELGGVSQEIAERLTELYLDKRWAKLSIGIGQISVKHGALLDRDVIQRAAEMVK